MEIYINKVHYPVTVLGPGKRLGIWLQGCHLHCQGCISQDTWEQSPEHQMPVSFLVKMCKDITQSCLDGITISGGEPFEQHQALSSLLDALIGWRVESQVPFDILCYSGLSIDVLKKNHSSILSKLDAVIPEPFKDELPRGQVWRGSTNQPLIPLSKLGYEKYMPCVEQEYLGKGGMQVNVDGKNIWYIGIPERTDMEALSQMLAKRGIDQEQISWRA